MVCLWFPGGSWMAALMVMLMALSPPLARARDTPAAHFLWQHKGECHFFNGTERVRLLERYIYDGQEYVRFDSDVGEYIAVTELGRPDAELWNSQKAILEDRRAAVDTYCRHNYGVFDGFLVQRQTVPTVTVSPAKTQRLQHHHLLVCSVKGFYPGHIEVRWLRDGREEQAGVVSTGLIRNGDWTFQMLVMLETVPRSGEVYTCQVEHPSSTSPISVEWSETPSDCPHYPPTPGPFLVPEARVPLPTPHFPLLGSLPQHRPQGSPAIALWTPIALGGHSCPAFHSHPLPPWCPLALAPAPVGWAGASASTELPTVFGRRCVLHRMGTLVPGRAPSALCLRLCHSGQVLRVTTPGPHSPQRPKQRPWVRSEGT